MQSLWKLISSRQGRAVVSVCVLVLLGVGAVNLDNRSPRQRAEAWAESHAAALPATLEELAAYPADYRLAIFEALPAAEKSRLWQIQLRSVLDTEPNLTADQRAFIVNVRAMATPASFSKDVPAPEVCPDIARLFTNPNQKEKVRVLGAGAVPVRTWRATWASLDERVRSAVSLSAEIFPCSCRGLGLCECGLFTACMDGNCEQNQNCGCIWSGTCDKMCEGAILNMSTKVGK